MLGKDLQPGIHGAQGKPVCEVLNVLRMFLARAFRKQDFKGFVDQLVAAITEKHLGVPVDVRDFTVALYHENGVGNALEYGPQFRQGNVLSIVVNRRLRSLLHAPTLGTIGLYHTQVRASQTAITRFRKMTTAQEYRRCL
jgi:hypothetical protein